MGHIQRHPKHESLNQGGVTTTSRLLQSIICMIFLTSAEKAWCASLTMSIDIAFASSLSFSNIKNVNLGVIKAEQPGTYQITPTGTVTTSNNGGWLGGSQNAGSMTIVGSDTQSININVTNYIADRGVTPSAATCSYNGGASSPCALSNQPPPSAGKELRLGLTVAVDGTQTPGTSATPTFDIIVNYN
jgi:hypothetical protein